MQILGFWYLVYSSELQEQIKPEVLKLLRGFSLIFHYKEATIDNKSSVIMKLF